MRRDFVLERHGRRFTLRAVSPKGRQTFYDNFSSYTRTVDARQLRNVLLFLIAEGLQPDYVEAPPGGVPAAAPTASPKRRRAWTLDRIVKYLRRVDEAVVTLVVTLMSVLLCLKLLAADLERSRLLGERKAPVHAALSLPGRTQ
jgi:hypothetical protein